MTSAFGSGAGAEDADLVSRMAAGDTVAFGEFYDRHSTLLFSIAFKVLADMQEAEEVLQDAARMIWEHAPLYNASLGRPASWAVVITRNKAIDRLRVLKRKSAALATLTQVAEEEFRMQVRDSSTDTVDDSAELLAKALASLPAEQRTPIELAFLQGFTQTEIAERLNQPLGTVKARIRRGMITMRDALEDQL